MSFSRIIALRKDESVAHGGAVSKRATVRFDASRCRGIHVARSFDPRSRGLYAARPFRWWGGTSRAGAAAGPGGANFCFHCGWPPARAPHAAPAPAHAKAPPVPDDRRIEIANPAAEELLAKIEELAASQEPPEPPPPPEDKSPFPARLFIEEGVGAGTTFPITTRETLLGAKAQVDLSGDPFVGPRAATLLFEEERLFLRDEASRNGVFFKLRDRDPGRLQPGDLFVAGERVLRYDGPVSLAPSAPVPGFLGAARPKQPFIRVTEILRGGSTGRICYRKGPVISIGRSGCDLNFPTDQRISAKHAEIRIAPDGTTMLADLGTARSGVLVRLRRNEVRQLFDGDALQVGGELLRVKFT
jgi:pSer/pThr/pTyr-binding forkhead associated (FHA) protein